MGFLPAQQAVLPVPSQELQSAARRKEMARRLHTRSTHGLTRVSLTPCQQTSGTEGEDFWRKHTLTNGSLCHNHSSFVSACHREMSHLCLKDVEITSVVSNPSTSNTLGARAGARLGSCTARQGGEGGEREAGSSSVVTTAVLSSGIGIRGFACQMWTRCGGNQLTSGGNLTV